MKREYAKDKLAVKLFDEIYDMDWNDYKLNDETFDEFKERNIREIRDKLDDRQESILLLQSCNSEELKKDMTKHLYLLDNPNEEYLYEEFSNRALSTCDLHKVNGIMMMEDELKEEHKSDAYELAIHIYDNVYLKSENLGYFKAIDNVAIAMNNNEVTYEQIIKAGKWELINAVSNNNFSKLQDYEEKKELEHDDEEIEY